MDTILMRLVADDFATLFMEQPAVVALNTSDGLMPCADDGLAARLQVEKLNSRRPPDIILADRSQDPAAVVFIDIGRGISDARMSALQAMMLDTPMAEHPKAFVAAFNDRETEEFADAMTDMAPGTLICIETEPEGLIELSEGAETLRDLIR